MLRLGTGNNILFSLKVSEVASPKCRTWLTVAFEMVTLTRSSLWLCPSPVCKHLPHALLHQPIIALSLVNCPGCVLWLVNTWLACLPWSILITTRNKCSCSIHASYYFFSGGSFASCYILPSIWEFPDWQILTIINYLSILCFDSLLQIPGGEVVWIKVGKRHQILTEKYLIPIKRKLRALLTRCLKRLKYFF